MPCRGEELDLTRPKDAVHSIEIFSEGPPDIPTDVSVAAREDAFAAAEAEDAHKIGGFATVKGSTATEVFDDRTVIVIDGLWVLTLDRAKRGGPVGWIAPPQVAASRSPERAS